MGMQDTETDQKESSQDDGKGQLFFHLRVLLCKDILFPGAGFYFQ
jgi:hypothetical protein